LSTSSVEDRAAELRDVLSRALVAYHVDDDPVMTDAAYDVLYDELVALEADHPELVTPESPTQRVGAPPSEKFQKVRHLSPMGSLDKVTTDEALAKWAPPPRVGTSRSHTCSSRRSTGLRSTSSTRTGASCAARRAATAFRVRT
jgi:NAD-dependent DNA ligase